VLRAFGTAIVLALLALCVTALWREPVERVSKTITNAAAASWGVGVLTPLAFVFIIPILAVISAILTIVCIGLFGFGLIAAASVALMIAGLMGWIALGSSSPTGCSARWARSL